MVGKRAGPQTGGRVSFTQAGKRKIKHICVSLSDLIGRASETGGMDRLEEALQAFRCSLDRDIESFLWNKAIPFIERGLCAVYLLLEEKAFENGQVKIDAYFTLSHKSLIPAAVSKTKVRNAAGRKDAKSIHFVLIGQLGKYIADTESGEGYQADVSAKEILDCAFEVIRASSSYIPCRCALVECSAEPKLHKLYRDYGFIEFQFDGEHYQFICRI